MLLLGGQYYGLTKPSPIIKLVTNSTPLPSALPARPRYTTYHTRGTHAVDEGLAASTIARRPPPPAPPSAALERRGRPPESSHARAILKAHSGGALYVRRRQNPPKLLFCCCCCCICSTGASGYLFAPRGCFLSCCKILFLYLLLAWIVLAITRATTPTTPCSYLGGSGGLPACDSASTRQSAPVSSVWTAVRES